MSGRMSEYIIEWFGIGEQLTRLREGNVPLVLWPKRIREERRREEIVRCRDCKRVEYCCFVYEYDYEPNGFCAWGERREVKPYVKPRTIEDVLRDLVDGIGDVEFDALTAIGEAADEIRELMEMGARPWEVER